MMFCIVDLLGLSQVYPTERSVSGIVSFFHTFLYQFDGHNTDNFEQFLSQNTADSRRVSGGGVNVSIIQYMKQRADGSVIHLQSTTSTIIQISIELNPVPSFPLFLSSGHSTIFYFFPHIPDSSFSAQFYDFVEFWKNSNKFQAITINHEPFPKFHREKQPIHIDTSISTPRIIPYRAMAKNAPKYIFSLA